MIEARKLSREQLRVLEGAVRRTEPLAFSAMSLIEIAVLTSDRKLKLPVEDFFDELGGNALFRLLPLTYEIAAEIAAVGSSLPDPADRPILATARVHRLRFVASDKRTSDS